MKNRVFGVLLGLVCFGLLTFLKTEVAMAAYSSASECVNASGYGSVADVQRMCLSDYHNTSEVICSHWLASPSNSASEIIVIDNPSITSIPLGLYGMCFKNGAPISGVWAENISMSNDGGSVAHTSAFMRGPWGNPYSVAATLNVTQFINGVAPVDSGDGYLTYTRDAQISRCYGGSMDEHSPGVCKGTSGTSTTRIILRIKKSDGNLPPVVSADCNRWVPGSYSQNVTSVVSRVKNTTLSEDWRKESWAKPTDRIDWVHCYYPGVQRMAGELATYSHGEESKFFPVGSTTENKHKRLSEIFSNWSNHFSVASSNLRNPSPNRSPSHGEWPFGDYTVRKIDDIYNIELNKAGKTLMETSQTGFPTTAQTWKEYHDWDCGWTENACGGECVKWDPDDPSNCLERKSTYGCTTGKCWHSNEYIGSKVSGQASDSVKVNVPYNFNNSATISLATSSNYVYAGETVTIGAAQAIIGTRQNNKTRGTYATHVENGMVGIVAYVSSSPSGSAKSSVGSGTGYNLCDAFSWEWCDDEKSDTIPVMNAGGSYYGSSEDIIGKIKSVKRIIDVYDAAAGKYFCVATAVYPANSGYDTNMNSSGSNSWYVSAPDCRIIAKKPSLQVWGAGMYTEGKILTTNAQKHVVNGSPQTFQVYNWSTNANIVFGTWVEQNIVANGLVNISSGAADGWRGGTSRSKGDFGGSYNNVGLDLCALHVLTMPNQGCKGALAGVGGAPNSMERPKDKEALIAKFASDNSSSIGTIERYDACSIAGAPSFNDKKTHVYKCDGDFTVNGNVDYFDDVTAYSKLVEIPKIIIYAKGDITIACGVTQVDAVLIAERDVNTCPDSDVNSPARSIQLQVNGVIISDRLLANRTYGAGMGNNSGKPAEIINYDTSLYLWGASRAAASESGKLITVYQTELAPRL